MKNLKLLDLTAAMGVTLSAGQAFAEVGYLDYQKVIENYPAAQQARKELETKELEIQQYKVDIERQYKNLTTPVQKQNFETQKSAELKSKMESYYRLAESKETQINNKVQEAARAVMVAQKLDAILSDQVIFVGGVDVTDMIIQRLK